MPDDNLIRVGFSVETGPLKAGLDEAAAVVRAQLDAIKAQYRQASAEVERTSEQLASATLAPDPGVAEARLAEITAAYERALASIESSLAKIDAISSNAARPLATEAALPSVSPAPAGREVSPPVSRSTFQSSVSTSGKAALSDEALVERELQRREKLHADLLAEEEAYGQRLAALRAKQAAQANQQSVKDETATRQRELDELRADIERRSKQRGGTPEAAATIKAAASEEEAIQRVAAAKRALADLDGKPLGDTIDARIKLRNAEEELAAIRRTSQQEVAITQQAERARAEASEGVVEAQKRASAEVEASVREAASTASEVTKTSSAEQSQAAQDVAASQETAGQEAASAAQQAAQTQAQAAQESAQSQKQAAGESQAASARSAEAESTAARQKREESRAAARAKLEALKEAAAARESEARKEAEAAQQVTRVQTESVSSQKAQLAILQQQHRAVAQEIATAVNHVVSAETQAAQATAIGRQQLAQEYQQQADREREDLDQLIAKQNELSAAILRTKKLVDEETSAMTAGYAKAQVAVGALANSTGRVEMGIVRLMASSEALAPILNAAFMPLMAVGAVEVLGQLASKFSDLIDAVAGFGKETQKQYRQFVDDNQRAAIEQLHLREALRGVADTGLTGQAKLNAETKALAENTKDAGRVLGQFTEGQRVLEERNTALTSGWNLWKTAATGWLDGTDREIKQNTASIEGQRKAVEELTRELAIQDKEQQARLAAESRAEASKQSIAVQGARIAAERTTHNALLAGETEYTRQARSLEQISAEEESRQLRVEAAEKLDIQKKYLAERRSLAIEEQAATGKPAAPELVAIAAELMTAENEYYRAISAIDTQLAVEKKRRAIEIATAQIEAAKRAAETAVQFEEQSARESYAIAKEKAESHAALLAGAAEKETAQLVAAEDKRSKAEADALNSRLALALNDKDKNAALIIQLHGEIEDAERQHQAKLAEIRREGDRQATADHKRIDAESEKIQALQVEGTKQHIEAGYAQEQTAIQGSAELGTTLPGVQKPQTPPVSQGVVSLGADYSIAVQEDKELQALHEKEYQEAVAANKREQQIYADDPAKLQELLNKEQQLSDRHNQQVLQENIKLVKDLEQNWQHFFDTFNQGFTQAIDKAIMGQQSFGKSMAQLYNQLVMEQINFVAKWLLKEAEKWALAKLFTVQHRVVETAADAAKVASATTANGAVLASTTATNAAIMLSNAAVNTAQVAGQAASATAATTADAAILAVTLPANVAIASSEAAVAAAAALAWWSAVAAPVAPAMAAATYAEGMTFAGMASLSTGGYTTKDGMAMLHSGEVVINHPITQMLGEMASGNAHRDTGLNSSVQQMISNRGGDVHNHIHAPMSVQAGGTTMSSDDFKGHLTAHADHLGRLFNRQLKQFNR